MFNIRAFIYYTGSSHASEYNNIVKLLEIVIFIRLWKILSLLYEIKSMRVVMETMRNLVTPLVNLGGVLFTIYYLFALIGMAIFGGKVQKNMKVIVGDTSIPDIYHLDNFNDLLTSIITLFTLMIVNNWMVTVQMFVDVMNNNSYYRWYFVAFYYFSVIIGINIVVAFAIDMYTSVERLDDDRESTYELLNKEISGKKDKDDRKKK